MRTGRPDEFGGNDLPPSSWTPPPGPRRRRPSPTARCTRRCRPGKRSRSASASPACSLSPLRGAPSRRRELDHAGERLDPGTEGVLGGSL